jgi:hypothetical protein
MPSLDLAVLWETHCRYEFDTRDVDVAGSETAHKVVDKTRPSNGADGALGHERGKANLAGLDRCQVSSSSGQREQF